MNIDCNITIGYSISSDKNLWRSLISGSQVCIVTNETIAPLYLSTLIQVFDEYQCSSVILPDGEAHKTLASWQIILDKLIADNHYCTTTLIALGGGVIGDMTGFAAACYQRGVAFIQVPTTLLAQVDAAIGGKTAVNYAGIKNLIGAFHQPKAVIIDTYFLSTLPEREFRAGLAEVIKYALIGKKKFFDYLHENVTAILQRKPEALQHIIKFSVDMKMFFVEQDEFDTKGLRALLNFGHTFGHALESVTNHAMLHGEAVAWGMRRACYLSKFLGYLSAEDVQRVEKLLSDYGLLFETPASVTSSALIAAMQRDKKKSSDALTVIVLEEIGQAMVTTSPEKSVLALLDADNFSQSSFQT